MKTCSTGNEYNKKDSRGRGAGKNKTEKDGGNVAIRQTLTEFKYAFFLKFFLCRAIEKKRRGKDSCHVVSRVLSHVRFSPVSLTFYAKERIDHHQKHSPIIRGASPGWMVVVG